MNKKFEKLTNKTNEAYEIYDEIPTLERLEKIVKTANENPKNHYLAYTKNFKLLNYYIETHEELPKNLSVVLTPYFENSTNIFK